jgi:hypothetical protein
MSGYRYQGQIGGFLWWLLIRFCKTKLEDEQTHDKMARNVFFIVMIVFVMMFIAVKFF